jgi:hypothetical protein
VIVAALALVPAAIAQPVLPGSTPGPAPGPAPASTPSGVITKITAQELAQLLSGIKVNNTPIRASIKTFDNGTADVVIPLWGPQVFSGVAMVLCEKDGSGCHWLEYFANLGKQASVGTNWINGLNGQFWGLKAYTLPDGQLVLRQDLPLWPGVSPADIAWHMVYFKNAVDNSFKFKPQ